MAVRSERFPIVIPLVGGSRCRLVYRRRSERVATDATRRCRGLAAEVTKSEHHLYADRREVAFDTVNLLRVAAQSHSVERIASPSQSAISPTIRAQLPLTLAR